MTKGYFYLRLPLPEREDLPFQILLRSLPREGGNLSARSAGQGQVGTGTLPQDL